MLPLNVPLLLTLTVNPEFLLIAAPSDPADPPPELEPSPPNPVPPLSAPSPTDPPVPPPVSYTHLTLPTR